MTKKERIALRFRGRQAHRSGENSSDCPWQFWSNEAHYWLAGWWQREYERTDPAIFKKPDYVPPELA